MHPPIRQVLTLSGGTIVLRAWGAHVADAYLLDLSILIATLGSIREEWEQWTPEDVTDTRVWASFDRLLSVSLDGTPLPESLTWADRFTILDALYSLNSLEESEGKLSALRANVLQRARRAQGISRASMSS